MNEMLALARAAQVHIEISDGVVALPRAEKLRAIERFAEYVPVFSEIGNKAVPIVADWPTLVKEELDAGAKHVVIEDRELGPEGREIRGDLVETLLDSIPMNRLVFEAIERKQQTWLIRHLGSNVNLGNTLPMDLMTVECIRQGLNHDTVDPRCWNVYKHRPSK